MNAAPLQSAFLTLLSHYRRHPGQLAMLLLGLWVASALWGGVQAINASARDSYARAESLFSSGLDRIERRDGRPLTAEDYLSLRLAGAPVSPLVTGELELADGSHLDVMGIDPLTLPGGSGFGSAGGTSALADFLLPPYVARVAADTRTAIQARGDGSPALADGRRLPPLETAPTLPPGLAVMDIAAALELLERDDLSQLLVAPEIQLELPDFLVRSVAANLAGPGQLSDSFHLNLTAMGLLALVVGLLIVHAALSLVLEQRLGLMRTLRALGLSARALVGLLLLELLMLGLLGAALGILSGVGLARWLLPDVAASLQSLYGERVGSQLVLPWHYWLGGLAVTLGGLLTAGLGTLWRAARLDVLGLGRAQAWRGQFVRQLRGMALAGGLSWLVALGLLVWLAQRPPAEGLIPGFAMVAAGLLGSALWLPPLLGLIVAGAGSLLRRRPLAQWTLADLQLQLPRLSVAMMALLLALAANLGVGSMVGGFRLTFLDWLDRRLVADLYLRVPAAKYRAAHDWLASRDDIAALLPRSKAEATLLAQEGADYRAQPVSIYGVTPHPVLAERWPLLHGGTDTASIWQQFADGAAMINEQLALSTGLSPGQRLRLSSAAGPLELTIAAVYPDYGNPRGEVLLSTALVSDRFQAPPERIDLLLERPLPPKATDALQRDLTNALGIGSSVGLTDQREVRRLATDMFERTFAITRALNVLTLGVAALALLSSLLAQTGQRRGQLAPLWALGVPRGPLIGAGFAQLGGIALVTALLAIPIGVGLSWSLVAVINVAAFGWRLPLHIFPAQILVTLILALGVALLAALLPAWRLWSTSPRRLLEEFEAL